MKIDPTQELMIPSLNEKLNQPRANIPVMEAFTDAR